MKEGFYWIQHNGVVQVAYYRHVRLTILRRDRPFTVSGI